MQEETKIEPGSDQERKKKTDSIVGSSYRPAPPPPLLPGDLDMKEPRGKNTYRFKRETPGRINQIS